MSDYKDQARPDRAPKQSRQKLSRHRAEPAAPATPWARLTAGIPSFGRRAAVVTTACAVLIGVGAASQAAEHPAPAASSEAASATAGEAPTLNFDKTLIAALPSPTAPAVAPQSIAKPAAPKAAPKTAAPKAAPTPAKAAAAAAAKVAPAAPAPKPAAAVAVNDPAGAQAYAASKLASFGWAADQMRCLQTLWTKESEWRTTATNASSGAYGVVQSLPAEKMASHGADFRTNYRTQINWGLDYVKERYGSPCGALNFHLANNWY
jgi:colicin import membrane protein